MLSSDWTHYCRSLEIERIKTLIDGQPISDPKILEIGAGDGYMSKALSEAGFNVTSIDPAPRKPLRYDVRKMDAYDLKFDRSSYDIILSSNVLEHILDLPKAFSEMKRVLKNGGIMIHAVPTVHCNMATMLLQPIAYFRNIFLLLSGRLKVKVNKNRTKLSQFLICSYKVAANILNPLRFIVAKGHGASKNRFWALYIWRRAHWRRIFCENGLEVGSIERVAYLYSMHKMFPFRMDRFRRIMGKKFNSVDIYCLKKNYQLTAV
jgi:2-polyprenyl-3-methyl-5-hydroxy-6-metoxy-1,4-benzoquinol methylase